MYNPRLYYLTILSMLWLKPFGEQHREGYHYESEGSLQL